MFSPRSDSKADGPLTVHVPAPADDRPSWAKVAVIAAIGFVVGVAWPRLAGVRLGPSVPESASTEAVAPGPSVRAAPPRAAPAPAPSPAPAVAPAATAAVALVPAPSAAPTSPEAAEKGTAGGGALTVGCGFVFACKTAEGDSLKGSQCGKLSGLDAVVLPRLRSVEACPASATVSGKMHFVVRADFARGTLAVELGKSQGPDAPEGLLACVRTSLAGASVAGVQHDYPAYAVAYTLAFGAPGAGAAAIAPAPAAPPATSGGAEGSSLVVWDVALVRDAPKTGKVVARLQRGTPLRLGSSKDGWYTVKFGDGFSSDGWVYRGAVGR